VRQCNRVPGGATGGALPGDSEHADNRRENMIDTTRVDWKAIDSRPEFQELHRKKMGFLWGLMIFSLVYYFLLPIGAAYFQDLYKVKVWGPVNVGLLFALSEFVVAWGIAFYYARRANAEFDPMAAEIVRDAEKRMGGAK
jgi:uncharacterized membrane protein (DUF485 family)